MGEDGAIVIRADLDDKQAQTELNRLERKISGLHEKIQRAESERMPLLEQARELGAQLDIAKEKLEQMQNAGPGKYTTEQIADQKETVASIQKQWDTATRQVERYDARINKANADIEWESNKAGELASRLAGVGEESETAGRRMRKAGDEGEDAGDRISKAMQKASDRIGRIGKKLIGMVRRVFLFSVITRALRSVREYFGNILNSTPEFTEALGQLKSAFLTLAQPLVSVIIPALTSLLQVITKIVTVIASLVAQLFGTTFEQSQEAAEALNEQAEAYKETGSAAKKASKQIAAFDQLNILSETNGGGGASKMKFDLPGIGEIKGFEKVREWFENLNFEPILEAWERLKESFSGLKETIGDAFSWFWDNVLAPLAKWTIEEAAPRMVDLLAKAFGFLDTVLERLGPILEPLWNNVLKPFIKWLGELVLTGLEELIDLLDKLTKLINGEISWKEFIDGLDGVQIALLALGGLAVMQAIGKVITGIASIPISIVKNIPKATTALGKMAKAIGIGALGVFDAVMIAYDVVKLKEAADTYHEAQLAHNNEMDTALSAYAKLYQEKGKEVADEWAKMVYNIDTTNMSFEEAQEEITKTVEGYWDGVPQNMWDGFKQGWETYFGEDGKGLWQLFKDAFTNVIDWLKDLLGIHSPSTVFDGIGQDICQGLWDGFSTTWNDFTSWLGSAWEGIKKWWNGLTLKAPEIQESTYTVSDSHSGSGRSLKVPGLASGSVIPPNREFLAVLGDQKSGTNIEAPLDTIVAAFKQAMGDMRGQGQDIQVKVYLDSREIKSGQQRLSRTMGV